MHCRRSTASVGLAGCLAVLVPLFLAGCGHGARAEKPVEAKAELPVVKAAVLTIEPRPWPGIVRTQGSLIADEVTVVGAKAAGRVAEVDVDLGDVVRADDSLAMLDQEEFRLQIALAEAQLLQARAALGLKPADPVESLNPENAPPVREAKAVLDEARARVERLRQLRVRNAVTQEEFDQAIAAEGVADARYGSAVNGVREKIAQINVRSAELSLAQQRLADTIVRAPFDGLVQERHVARGSFVQIGSPVVTLVRTGALRFRGVMPERHAHRLALGQTLRLKIEGAAEPREAVVTRISPAVDELTRSLAFEATVDNPQGDLRTGLFAEAEVIVDPTAQALVVPESAIVEFAGAEKVWKVVDGVAHEQVVQSARRSEDAVEIASGLAPGDQILLDGAEGRVARIEPISPAAAGYTAMTHSATPPEPLAAGAAATGAPPSEPAPRGDAAGER